MEPSDENITVLLGMGFDDIGKVRQALEISKNDLNEAVSVLTGEGNHDLSGDLMGDIEMKDTQYKQSGGDIMPSLTEIGPLQNQKQFPPSYDEIVGTRDDDMDPHSENVNIPLDSVPNDFPVTNLYELEERIFTENWSIPYRKNESLGKCLLGATKLIIEGMIDRI